MVIAKDAYLHAEPCTYHVHTSTPVIILLNTWSAVSEKRDALALALRMGFAGDFAIGLELSRILVKNSGVYYPHQLSKRHDRTSPTRISLELDVFANVRGRKRRLWFDRLITYVASPRRKRKVFLEQNQTHARVGYCAGPACCRRSVNVSGPSDRRRTHKASHKWPHCSRWSEHENVVK